MNLKVYSHHRHTSTQHFIQTMEHENKGKRGGKKKGLEITIEGEGSRKFRTFSECLETLERIFDAYGRVEKAWNLKEKAWNSGTSSLPKTLLVCHSSLLLSSFFIFSTNLHLPSLSSPPSAS